MKLTTVLLIASLMQVSGKTLAQEISLRVSNASLKSVFIELRKQSGFTVLCKSELISKSRPVTVNLERVPLENALIQILNGQNLKFTIEDKAVLIQERNSRLSAKNPEAFQVRQQQTLTGQVTDVSGVSLIGVGVKLKDSGTGTTTNADGNYVINSPADGILIFSYVGYLTQEVPINNQKTINIKLVEGMAGLSEVVVVGYGTQKKINLTGAVSVVKGSELANRPVVNATQALQGMVPGLNVNVAGNTRPGQSFNLNIRGLGNLTNSDNPYILVDGFEMSLSDVNPNDIESISVLKDASAAAIYGARAAYGVILVTTKRGSAEKIRVAYSSNAGLTSPIKLPDMANSFEFANYFNTATFNALGTKQYSEEKLALLAQFIEDPTGISSYPEVNSNSLYPGFENNANGVANTNWFNFHYKPYSLRQTHNLSLSGGNKITQFYISGGYYNEGGSMRFADINYNRYNINANINSQLNSWIKVKADTKYIRADYSTPFSDVNFENNFFNGLSRMRPNFSPYDLNGNYSESSMVPYLQSGSNSKENNNTLNIIAGLELEPVKNWKIFLDYNLKSLSSDQAHLKLPGTIYGIDGTPTLVNRTEYVIPLGGSFSRGTGSTLYLSPNIYTSYQHSIKRHNFSATLGYQQESSRFQNISGRSQDLISATRPGLDLVTGTKTFTESRSHWATQGGFGRINYNFDEKYLFEFNGRYDGSSRFSPDSRWGFFPSVSAGYNISREKFMQPLEGWIDQLKIRGSYGFLGNQSGAGLYTYSENMNVVIPSIGLGAGSRYYFGNSREAFIRVPGAFNPGITWEKVENANLGLDFSAFKSHFTGSFDIYKRDTRDMLGPTSDIADLYGANPPLINNADLTTKGWELTLNWRGNISKELQFSIGGLVSDYKAVITKYQNPSNFDPPNAFYEGKTANEIWGYRASGLIQTIEEAAEYNKLNRTHLSPLDWKPGDVRYLDLNNDGSINNGARRLGEMGDMEVIGNSTPRFAYSVNGTLGWKGINLYMLWQGIGKRDFSPQPLDSYFWGSASFAQVTVFREHLDHWTPETPGAYYPNPYTSAVGPILTYANKTQTVSDRYIQNAAYIRLKNLTVSYTIPKAFSEKIKLSRINVFATGENLITITKLAGMFDPETLQGAAGVGKIYPLSKVFSFGINLDL